MFPEPWSIKDRNAIFQYWMRKDDLHIFNVMETAPILRDVDIFIGQLEFADEVTMLKSLENRREM